MVSARGAMRRLDRTRTDLYGAGMNARASYLLRLVAMLAFMLPATRVDGAGEKSGTDELLSQGSSFRANGRMATVTALDSLPYVESEYTKRFAFDSFANPLLKELREQYRLQEVVDEGKDEFERQVRLMDWVHHRFKKFGKPSINAKGALAILNGIENGETFFCAHYAQLMVSCAASLGWVDRELALRRHQGVAQGGSSEHSTTEIWSNQFAKWVMLDPTSNMYLEKSGVPLNAFEIREEWFYRQGNALVFVIGKERKRYKKQNLPIILGHFEGFGNLTIDPDELDKYGFIGYIPNTNLMDVGEDYAQMFIVKDKLCEGTKWHVRKLPEDPASDPYFPINQAALSLTLRKDALSVALKTLTPNFKTFETKLNDEEWKTSPPEFVWTIRPGRNRLAARARNEFGLSGAVSSAEVTAAE
jgi:hypothetical protein